MPFIRHHPRRAVYGPRESVAQSLRTEGTQPQHQGQQDPLSAKRVPCCELSPALRAGALLPYWVCVLVR